MEFDLLLNWLESVWRDFSVLTPTAQITFLIGGLTFVAALTAGAWKVISIFRKVPSDTGAIHLENPGSERNRIIAMIEAGDVSAKDATELARVLYGRAAFTHSSLQDVPQQFDDEAEKVVALTGGDEERRAFIDVVTELATSEEATDRSVILKYTRGDRAAALATLIKRADNAGELGAAAWREVASLAMPFDHLTAIKALQKAADLDLNDIVSLCRLSRVLARTEDLPGARAAAEMALSRATENSHRGRARVMPESW